MLEQDEVREAREAVRVLITGDASESTAYGKRIDTRTEPTVTVLVWTSTLKGRFASECLASLLQGSGISRRADRKEAIEQRGYALLAEQSGLQEFHIARPAYGKLLENLEGRQRQ